MVEVRKAAPMTEGPWGLSLRQSKDSGSEEDRWFWGLQGEA